MKIYHVETQQSYDELMSELEVKGHKWLSGYKPTSKKYWEQEKENTCIAISGKNITFRDIEQSKNQSPNIPIIEYKSKGENMEEENKHNLQKIAFDVSVAIESFARDMSEAEADLKEAKSSAKKLIEKIDEYLESQKPEFKVGDYVVEQSGDVISKIEEVINGRFFGSYYKRFENYFYSCSIFPNNIERYATPKEIAEYEVALTFHKRGRKPFEVKEGDIISDSEEEKIFVDVPSFWGKEDFTGGDYTLLKTAEEVKEWIENK